jgi:mRNA interferase RelE/StbE
MGQVGRGYKISIQKETSREIKKSSCTKSGSNLYKIKLRSVGYRLVYEVDDYRIVVLVLAVGQRNRNLVYNKAATRIK